MNRTRPSGRIVATAQPATTSSTNVRPRTRFISASLSRPSSGLLRRAGAYEPGHAVLGGERTTSGVSDPSVRPLDVSPTGTAAERATAPGFGATYQGSPSDSSWSSRLGGRSVSEPRAGSGELGFPGSAAGS